MIKSFSDILPLFVKSLNENYKKPERNDSIYDNVFTTPIPDIIFIPNPNQHAVNTEYPTDYDKLTVAKVSLTDTDIRPSKFSICVNPNIERIYGLDKELRKYFIETFTVKILKHKIGFEIELGNLFSYSDRVSIFGTLPNGEFTYPIMIGRIGEILIYEVITFRYYFDAQELSFKETEPVTIPYMMYAQSYNFETLGKAVRSAKMQNNIIRPFRVVDEKLIIDPEIQG